MLNKILVALGLRRNVGGPTHVGASPVYFTYVYEGKQGFVFAWHTPDHSQGEVSHPHYTKESAELAQEFWEENKKKTQRANFVRP